VSSNGDNNQIAGRDINNNINRLIASINKNIQSKKSSSFHIYSKYKDIHNTVARDESLRKTITEFYNKGYKPISISSDMRATDCIFILFEQDDGLGNITCSNDRD